MLHTRPHKGPSGTRGPVPACYCAAPCVQRGLVGSDLSNGWEIKERRGDTVRMQVHRSVLYSVRPHPVTWQDMVELHDNFFGRVT